MGKGDDSVERWCCLPVHINRAAITLRSREICYLNDMYIKKNGRQFNVIGLVDMNAIVGDD